MATPIKLNSTISASATGALFPHFMVICIVTAIDQKKKPDMHKLAGGSAIYPAPNVELNAKILDTEFMVLKSINGTFTEMEVLMGYVEYSGPSFKRPPSQNQSCQTFHGTSFYMFSAPFLRDHP